MSNANNCYSFYVFAVIVGLVFIVKKKKIKPIPMDTVL